MKIDTAFKQAGHLEARLQNYAKYAKKYERDTKRRIGTLSYPDDQVSNY
jgi:type II secretory pathway component PulF